jgi:hypothetical protein
MGPDTVFRRSLPLVQDLKKTVSGPILDVI